MSSPVTEQELISLREANATPSWGQIIATFSQSENGEVSSVVGFQGQSIKIFSVLCKVYIQCDLQEKYWNYSETDVMCSDGHNNRMLTLPGALLIEK